MHCSFQIFVTTFLMNLQLTCLRDSVAGQLIYATMARACSHNSDCRRELGEVCLKMYDGCDKGTCGCDTGFQRDYQTLICLQRKLGGDPCVPVANRCPARMKCLHMSCQCVRGYMTRDGTFCLTARERFIGERCKPYLHQCFRKKDSGTYTPYEATCNARTNRCVCFPGYREQGRKCVKRAIGETGCAADNHCTGDAMCIDNMCQCPTNFQPTPDNSRCARIGAAITIPKGETCDELGQNGYCSSGLVCVRCPLEQDRKCAFYKMASSAVQLKRTSSSLLQFTCLYSVIFILATNR